MISSTLRDVRGMRYLISRILSLDGNVVVSPCTIDFIPVGSLCIAIANIRNLTQSGKAIDACWRHAWLVLDEPADSAIEGIDVGVFKNLEAEQLLQDCGGLLSVISYCPLQ